MTDAETETFCHATVLVEDEWTPEYQKTTYTCVACGRQWSQVELDKLFAEELQQVKL